MKVRFSFLALAIAALAAGAYLLHRSDAEAVRKSSESAAPDRPTSGADSSRFVPRESIGAESVASRLRSARNPAELSRIANSAGTLRERDIEGVKTLSRDGRSAQRMIALKMLAKLRDGDGTILAAFEEASRASAPEVSHTALDAMRTYQASNPAAARAVGSFLLSFANSCGDTEFAAVALGAMSFDSLEASDGPAFSALLSHPDREIRLAAIETAAGARLHRREARELLSNAILLEKFDDLRARISETLKQD